MTTAPEILILTPIKNAANHLETYFTNLLKLSYPNAHISLGILEGDSRDDSYQMVLQRKPELIKHFSNVGIWQKNYGYHVSDTIPRWQPSIQPMRRNILARSRNYLLSKALQEQQWVLWLDVDIIEYPADIIEQLLATKKNIVHPNCVLEYGGLSFDQNAWRGQDKQFLSQLRDEGPLVKLDSVGGTMLLIAADLHRDGLIFPPFRYRPSSPIKLPNDTLFIETEGLGLMARDMGQYLWGMPNLEIKHK